MIYLPYPKFPRQCPSPNTTMPTTTEGQSKSLKFSIGDYSFLTVCF